MVEAQHKIALVIGINGGPETGLPPLRYAEETACQVARMLKAPASDFTLHGGGPLLGAAATTDAVRRAIFDARRAAGRNGMLLIYYIGHGRYITDASGHSDVFLVTYNFRPDDAREDPGAHLSMEWLQEKVLRHSTPDRLLLILDCCYAGAVGDAAPDPVVANLRRRLTQALNIQSTDTDDGAGGSMRKTLAAVSPWLRAYERDGATCYSAALLRGLAGAAALEDGRVNWQSLHARLQGDLADAQPGEYGFDRSSGATLAYYPDRAHLRTPEHQPFVMPHHPMPGFVGREEELNRLAIMLTGENATDVTVLPSIAGIGGIGKTRLAIEFVHRYRAHFPDGVFWLSMEQPETIETQVAACGGARGLQLFDDEPGEQLSSQTIGFDSGKDRFERTPRLSLHQRAEQVRTIWEGPGKRLIVFDNLEDPALLEQWRPRGGGSRLLITTRRQSWKTDSGVRLLRLTSLMDENSQELLLGPRAIERGCSIADLLADPCEARAAQDIVRELGGLPLALTLAGRYLAEYSMTLAHYLEQLRTESINHRSLNDELAKGLPPGQRAGIVASFVLSYQCLGKDPTDHPTDHRARTIWLAAAQLAPEPILDEVLIRAAELDPTDDAQREQGEQALRRLRELGLIERAEGAHRLHRLLRAYAHSVTNDLATDWRRAVRGLVQTIWHLITESKLSAPPFREHVRQLLNTGAADRDSDKADLLHAAGLVMCQDEDYPAARQHFQEALAIKETVLGRRHRSTALTLHELGRVALEEGDYPAARQHFQEALAIEETVLGRHHRSTAVTLHELGDVASAEGDHPAARQHFQEALAIKETVLGRRHRETARTLHELGNVAFAEGDHPAARQHFQEALEIEEAVLGRRHRDTAVTLHALGNVAFAEGDHPAARQHFQEALEIEEAVLGRRHRETARTLHELGNVAYAEGDYPAARQHFQEALEIKETVLGRRHREIAFTLHQLGNVAFAEGDYPAARQHFQEALEIKETVLGRRHRSTALTLYGLGQVAFQEGDYPAARRYFQEDLEIREAVLGRRHRETALTLHELGRVALEEGDYPAARQHFQEALAIKEAVLGRRHRETAVTLHELGNVAYAEGDYPAARQHFQEALEIGEAVLGRRHRETATTLDSLGKVAFQEGDYPAARQHFQEALAIKEAVLGRRHRETALILHELGNVAYAEGDYPAARQHFQEALAIKEAVLGRRHREIAFTLHQLGNVAYAEGDYPAARQHFQEALAIKEAVLGRRHREIAFTLHQLGNVAYAEGDYPAARQHFQEALAIKETVLGRRHRSTAVTLHALGRVALAEGDYPAARQHFQEALAIKETVLGRRHRETEITLSARHSLFWRALFETVICSLLTWFLLPEQIDLVAVSVVLLLGTTGYYWWRAATRLLRAVWRFQLGWLGMTLLLHLLGHVNVVISPTTLYALSACGGAVGLFWPRIIALQVVRAIRSRLRRWWYLTRQQLLRRRRRSVSSDQSQERTHA